MEKTELLSRIQDAMSVFLERHRPLLEVNVNERAIAHKFAECLASTFPALDIDCEYNRHLEQEKRLTGVREYVRAQRRSRELADIEEEFGICVSPDIIIHRRRTDEANLVVIEVKKTGNPLPAVEYDFLKIRSYIREIGYDYGLYVEFGVRDESGVRAVLLFMPGMEELEDITPFVCGRVSSQFLQHSHRARDGMPPVSIQGVPRPASLSAQGEGAAQTYGAE